jgi:hypothetical protein
MLLPKPERGLDLRQGFNPTPKSAKKENKSTITPSQWLL